MKIYVKSNDIGFDTKPNCNITGIELENGTVVKLLDKIGTALSVMYVPGSKEHQLGTNIVGLVQEYRLKNSDRETVTNARPVQIVQSIATEANLDVGLARHHISLEMSTYRALALIGKLARAVKGKSERGTTMRRAVDDVIDNIAELIGEVE